MDFDQITRKQLALSGGFIGGLFAFLATYSIGKFVANDKPLAYFIALVVSVCFIFLATGFFSQMLEAQEKR